MIDKIIDVFNCAKKHEGALRSFVTALNGKLYVVSTVQLIMPVIMPAPHEHLLETMVFRAVAKPKCKCGCGNPSIADFVDVYCNRYKTWPDAKAGHAAVCAGLVAGSLKLYGDTPTDDYDEYDGMSKEE